MKRKGRNITASVRDLSPIFGKIFGKPLITTFFRCE